MDIQNNSPYQERPVAGSHDALDAVLETRDKMDLAYRKSRITYRIAFALVVAGYVLVLYAVYHAFPSARTLIYVVVAVIMIWASDYRGMPDANDLGRPRMMHFGMGVVPIQFSLSTANMCAWIMLCVLLAQCFSEVASLR